MTIGKRIFVPLSILVVLFISALAANYYYTSAKEKKSIYKDEIKKLTIFFNKEYKVKEDFGLTNAIMLSGNEFVTSMMMDGSKDYTEKGLKGLLAEFKKDTDLKNVKIQIHDPTAYSMLRVWDPTKFGDNLSSYRKTILHVIKTKKPLVAIEIGPLGLVLRGVAPIIEDHSYLGSVEFIQGFNSILKDAKREKKEVIIVMKKQYLNIATALKKSEMLGDYVLAVHKKNINLEFMNELKGIDISKSNTLLKSKNYIFVSVPMKDFSGKIVGYALVGQNKKIVNKVVDSSMDSVFDQIVASLIAFLAFMLILYFIIKKAVLTPLSNLTQRAKELSSGDGDLTQKLEVNGNDEIALASIEINNFIEKVRV
ncbi:MAG: cache domain-containing protein, partial [Sulfurospirillaceae bacterium]|nr:cache domain-containing protein [Sulfurospirillaceae bacterium]